MAKTLADLKAKEGLTVTKEFDHYENDDAARSEEVAPTFSSFMVEGEGVRTMVNWPPQGAEDQQAIDNLVNPPAVVVSNEKSNAQVIDEANDLNELKVALKKLLG